MRGGQAVYPLEEHSSVPRIVRSPELLERMDSAQCLGFRLVKPPSSIPKPSLQLRRVSQKVRVIAVDRVQLGLLNASVCAVKPPLVK